MSAGYQRWSSTDAVRRVMRANRRRDTKPELAVRRAIHAVGLRYRVDSRPLIDVNRRADLVFRPAKVAVFIDGCYWHGCLEHGTRPLTNSTYWSSKIERNIARDAETNRLLLDAGWLVIRVWEHEDPHDAACRIANAVRPRRLS